MNNDFYTVNSMITELGISKSTQAKLRATKDIPFYKKNNKIFYDRLEIKNWIRGKEES